MLFQVLVIFLAQYIEVLFLLMPARRRCTQHEVHDSWQNSTIIPLISAFPLVSSSLSAAGASMKELRASPGAQARAIPLGPSYTANALFVTVTDAAESALLPGENPPFVSLKQYFRCPCLFGGLCRLSPGFYQSQSLKRNLTSLSSREAVR